jgi:hypothetical protein
MRQIGLVLSLAMAVAALRLGWVWFERRESHARMERGMRTGAGGVPDEDPGSAVRITQFYARSAETIDGESNLVCYGVRNARAVRMEPPVETLAPTLNRCFFIEPHQDTTYKLVAEGDDGSQASASFQVRVKPAAPEIRMFAVSEKRIVRGDAVTLCYGVAHSTAVRLEPDGFSLAPATQNCVRIYPKVTGTFTLVATGADGRTQRKQFAVAVR